jgi:hypothetical protein
MPRRSVAEDRRHSRRPDRHAPAADLLDEDATLIAEIIRDEVQGAVRHAAE